MNPALAQDRPLVALRWIERALELEYARPGGPVRLDALDAAFTDLFVRYNQIVVAARTLEQPPPDGLAARVARAADRWRALASDPAEPCERAAWLLAALGRADLAWEYLVSPVAREPASAALWSALAGRLHQQGELELADACWAQAVELEPTNGDYLWYRAALLRERGRMDLARPLLERLAAGPWQPRFEHYRAMARDALQER